MMKKLKWKSVPIIVLVFVLALSACSNQKTSTPSSSSKDKPYNGQTVNVLLVEQDSTKELKNKLIPEFEKQSGIKVNVDILPESAVDTKLPLSLSTNTGDYDVVMTGAKNWSQLVSSGWIKPLDKYLSDSKYSPDAYSSGFSKQLLETSKYNGKIYAMPYQVGADMLFYNKDMFKAAGLDPNNPPNTVDELLQDAKKLNNPDKGQYGIVTRGTREGNANSFSWIMMWMLNGGRWADSNGKEKYDVLDQPEAIKTTQEFKELTKYAPSGIGSYNFTEAQLAMQQGKAAMWLDAAQLGPSLEDKSASKIAGHVGYHVLQGKGGDYVAGPVWGFSMANSTKNEGAAWEVIKFLTGKEVTLKQTISGTNGSPARLDVLKDPQVAKVLNPEFTKALAEATSHVNPRYSPLIPEGTQIRSELSKAISEVISGNQTPEEAMKNTNEKVKSILKGK